ncbi:Krueppel homolog 1-like [Phlebotomus argentipes]|uniref:Krueppel homolog 1-like n=1 Tax=Phlebotomus argentipes TaxID=94469 RepID=UPI002892A2DD|nr:Krueppel homolog 1-like [Phlebotomus argentipes]
MVYYTALPLIMQTEASASQLCACPSDATDAGRPSTSSTSPSQYHQLGVPSTSAMHTGAEMLQTYTPAATYHVVSPGLAQKPLQAPPAQQMSLQPPPQKPQFKCEQCNMCFGSKSAHTSHMKSHAKQFATQQQFQQPVAATGESLQSSVLSVPTVSPSDPYQCDVCKKTFSVPARLVRHYRTHTGERPFECEFCHKMFSVKENLQVHRRIHTKERPYKCDVCGRAFEHSGKLHRHMRIHTGERPHKCSVCAKTFIQSGQLVIHMRTHTGEKPYKCPVEGCGKGFTCSKQLKVHSRTHTGEKPYHCDICFRDFGYNHVLKLHRVQHYGSKCYKCTICDETFKNKKEMEAHIKGHANELPDDDDVKLVPEVLDAQPLDESVSPPMEPTMAEPHPVQLDTPRESSSETNSDGDDVTYYNMYSRFEQSVVTNYGVSASGVNPALLAAASIAAAATVAGFDDHKDAPAITTAPQPLPPAPQSLATPAAFYEPASVMRQHSYFTPAPTASDFRSSLDSASDLVKRVEAALAGTEPLLTPPRSSPESPERASSPESDSVLMADRDVMSLPLRKRKLYLKDDQGAPGGVSAESTSPMMRMSSVIQFAKAS